MTCCSQRADAAVLDFAMPMEPALVAKIMSWDSSCRFSEIGISGLPGQTLGVG